MRAYWGLCSNFPGIQWNFISPLVIMEGCHLSSILKFARSLEPDSCLVSSTNTDLFPSWSAMKLSICTNLGPWLSLQHSNRSRTQVKSTPVAPVGHWWSDHMVSVVSNSGHHIRHWHWCRISKWGWGPMKSGRRKWKWSASINLLLMMLTVRTERMNEWMNELTNKGTNWRGSLLKHFKDCHAGNQLKNYHVGKFNLLL